MSRMIEFTNGSKWIDTTSHSERQIYDACLGIIEDLVSDFQEWYEERHGNDAVKEMPEEELFGLYYNPQTLVRRLFLSGTMHSGASTTRAKMDELEIDREWIEFGFTEEEDEE